MQTTLECLVNSFHFKSMHRRKVGLSVRDLWGKSPPMNLLVFSPAASLEGQETRMAFFYQMCRLCVGEIFWMPREKISGHMASLVWVGPSVSVCARSSKRSLWVSWEPGKRGSGSCTRFVADNHLELWSVRDRAGVERITRFGKLQASPRLECFSQPALLHKCPNRLLVTSSKI